MSISSGTLLTSTTTALAEQVKYNDQRYIKKGESSGGISITVGTSAPADKSIWLDTSNYQQGGGE